MLVVLLLLRGGDEPQPGALPAAPSAAGVADAKNGDGKAKGDEAAKPSKGTKFVSESSFSLALPAGWQRVDPPAGATFAAVAAAGGADATLWITQDPKLDFPIFVSQSLEQLKTLAGSAQVIERTPAPTAEGTIVRLAADAPAGPAELRGHPAGRRPVPLLPRDHGPAGRLPRGRRRRRPDHRVVHPGAGRLS